MGIKIKDKNTLPRIVNIIQELKGKSLQIGIFGDADSHLLVIARVNEFGCEIEVTPKMRGWFAAQGFPLKKSTDTIVIPERSFFRTGFDINEAALSILIKNLLPSVIKLKLSPMDFYGRIGEWMVSKVQDRLNSLSDPANSKMTKAMKGSDNPLIDDGRLIQSITWRVV